jgi:hypothetical protein
MDPIDWVTMTFDPELKVNPHEMIRVMRGEVVTLSKDQWEDAKEACADMIEQFVAMRKERG